MNTLSYKTNSVKAEEVKKEWVVIDATDQVLGRLCAKVAKILRGKYKPCYTPHVDCGDNVIIINADKVKMTGKKWTERIYISYTGYPGGQRYATPEILQKKSERKGLTPGMHPLFLRVCSLRIVLVLKSSRTCTFITVLNTHTKLSNQR